MSFGDAFSKFKTFGMQKIGKAEKTAEPAEFVEMVQNMKKTKEELQALLEISKKWHKRQHDAAESFENLGAAFTKLSSSESSTRASLLAAVPMISKTSVAQIEYLNTFKVSIIDTIANILEIQIKAAEKAGKKVSDSRLEFDAKQSSFKSTVESKKSTQEDIDASKRKADDAEANYNQAKEGMIEACTSVEQIKQEFLSTKMSEFAKAIGECGANMANNAQSYLDEAN